MEAPKTAALTKAENFMVSIVEGGGNEIGRSFWFYDEVDYYCDGVKVLEGGGRRRPSLCSIMCFAKNLNWDGKSCR